MNTQEVILTPRTFYRQNKLTLQVLEDPKLERKAKSLTLLKRNETITGTSPEDKKKKKPHQKDLKSRYADSGLTQKNQRNFEN